VCPFPLPLFLASPSLKKCWEGIHALCALFFLPRPLEGFGRLIPFLCLVEGVPLHIISPLLFFPPPKKKKKGPHPNGQTTALGLSFSPLPHAPAIAKANSFSFFSSKAFFFPLDPLGEAFREQGPSFYFFPPSATGTGPHGTKAGSGAHNLSFFFFRARPLDPSPFFFPPFVWCASKKALGVFFPLFVPIVPKAGTSSPRTSSFFFR